MVRDIVIYPNEILKKPTEKVDVIDKEVKNLIRDMFDTMYEAEGVGLAANQIGVPLSVMVIDTSPKEDAPPLKLVLINPEIKEGEGKIKYKEGCLSFPGLSVEVERFQKVKVNALNEHGEPVELTLEGFPAIVFQHELDHLKGITFVDRLKGWRRRMALEKYQKLLKSRK
ncbi:peptide deformylase [Aquifex aeolicus]|uniref:Peptide deformylase n=1 Tax=Aquifex aeolicus (strain VF5) TaxID=224324 RepID=DEF_AQUAE|nr:peptide deformylase [Aquifex aeolicus]O66847.1 RecName: Full=Peptide deformylase; Short=PDF; AltName: Full=Polypeptide deformylase [Aquifex aeolicus VF5]AAC06802.1 polypeptide deformylase [Aquifex aeolicus VF5]